MYVDYIKYPWITHTESSFSISFAGQIDDFREIISATKQWLLADTSLANTTRTLIRGQSSCFGLIVENETHCLAIADQVRSYPIFYGRTNAEIVLGTDLTHPSIQRLCSHQDDTATEEFLLCGYVLGNKTLFNDLSILRAGESLLIDKRNWSINTCCYYSYLPKHDVHQELEPLVKILGDTLDTVFQKVIRQANNRPIWVPLSGGVDSRLILCKLVEHGCKNVTCFTYGINHNHEMKRARLVAKTLDVPWLQIPSQTRKLRNLYQSKQRKGYTDYAYGGHAVPVWLDFEAVTWLVQNNHLTKDAIIINGYSGDFIFGGHIPEKLTYDPSVETLVNSLLAKHCSHFKSNVLSKTYQTIKDNLVVDLKDHAGENPSLNSLCTFLEHWDWQERQVKAVVNGQRLYEYYNLDWLLPLWDRSLVDFSQTIPLPLRVNQKLHIQYLRDYDFMGLFKDLRSADQLWTPLWRWIPAAGKLLETCLGEKTKFGFYEHMYYFGFHRFQLGLFGKKQYYRSYRALRRPYVVPLAAIAQLDDLSLKYPNGILDHRS